MSEGGDQFEKFSKLPATFTGTTNLDKNSNEIGIDESLGENGQGNIVIVEIPFTTPTSPPPAATNSEANKDPPQESRSSESSTLRTFLASSTDGKLILKSFKDYNHLTPKNRARLVRLIIRREFDSVFCDVPDGEALDEFTITAKRFKTLARETCELFSEVDPHIYYIPSCSEGDSVTTTAGSFWYHYNYLKGVYRKNGLLRKPSSSTTADPIEKNTSPSGEKLAWLETHLEPWEEIVSVWGETFYDRKRLLADEEKSVYDYVNQFPCLQLQEGSNLLKADFRKLYPGKEDILFQRWPTIRTVIQQHLQHVTIKNPTDKAFFFLLQTAEPEHQDAIILHLLPYLFDGRSRPGKRKYLKKSTATPKASQSQLPKNYSLQERREGLLLHVNTAADVEPSLQELKNNLKKRGDKLQPSLVVIGPLHKIEEAIVVVDNIRYQVPSCLHALDLAFKSFFALDCEYPNCATLLWIFIQKSGYDLNLPADQTSQSLSVVCSQVSRALAES